MERHCWQWATLCATLCADTGPALESCRLVIRCAQGLANLAMSRRGCAALALADVPLLIQSCSAAMTAFPDQLHLQQATCFLVLPPLPLPPR